MAKSEGDLLKANEDIDPHKSRNCREVCMVGATSLPAPYKRLKIFATLRSYIFARLRRITFKLNKFTNQFLGAFSLSCTCQKLKKRWKGLFMDKIIIITSH